MLVEGVGQLLQNVWGNHDESVRTRRDAVPRVRVRDQAGDDGASTQ